MSDAGSQELEKFKLQTDVGVIGGLQNAVAANRQTGEAPLTVVLHGAGGGARSVAGLGQLLQVDGPLFVPDLSGYGNTKLTGNTKLSGNTKITRNTKITEISAQKPDALALHRLVIDTLLESYCQPGQSVVIVGHSMGGFLGLLTALAGKWPVSALVAIEPVAFSVLDPVEDAEARAEDLHKVLALDAALKTDQAEAALAGFITYWSDVEWSAIGGPLRQFMLAQVDQIAAETLAVAQDQTPPESYRHLQVPVLLLQGELTVAPATAAVRRLQNLLPSVEVKTVAGAGHMEVARQPMLFAPQINEYLNRHTNH